MDRIVYYIEVATSKQKYRFSEKLVALTLGSYILA
jgi:hypothetical protein